MCFSVLVLMRKRQQSHHRSAEVDLQVCSIYSAREVDLVAAQLEAAMLSLQWLPLEGGQRSGNHSAAAPCRAYSKVMLRRVLPQGPRAAAKGARKAAAAAAASAATSTDLDDEVVDDEVLAAVTEELPKMHVALCIQLKARNADLLLSAMRSCGTLTSMWAGVPSRFITHGVSIVVCGSAGGCKGEPVRAGRGARRGPAADRPRALVAPAQDVHHQHRQPPGAPRALPHPHHPLQVPGPGARAF